MKKYFNFCFLKKSLFLDSSLRQGAIRKLSIELLYNNDLFYIKIIILLFTNNYFKQILTLKWDKK